MSLFTDDVIVYVANLKESTEKFLELLSNYSKDAGYEINIQKPTLSLYISNEVEFDIKQGSKWLCNYPNVIYLVIIFHTDFK